MQYIQLRIFMLCIVSSIDDGLIISKREFIHPVQHLSYFILLLFLLVNTHSRIMQLFDLPTTPSLSVLYNYWIILSIPIPQLIIRIKWHRLVNLLCGWRRGRVHEKAFHQVLIWCCPVSPLREWEKEMLTRLNYIIAHRLVEAADEEYANWSQHKRVDGHSGW